MKNFLCPWSLSLDLRLLYIHSFSLLPFLLLCVLSFYSHRLPFMANRVTLFEPPPLDATKAPIENVLDLTPVIDIGPVCFFEPLVCIG